MGLIDVVERDCRKKGLREGLLVGMGACLKLKFPGQWEQFFEEILRLENASLLWAICDAIEPAGTLDDLRRLIPASRLDDEKPPPFMDVVQRKQYQRGMRQGLLTGIKGLLRLKFGAEGLRLMPDPQALMNNEYLLAVMVAIETVPSLDDLIRIWPKR